MADPSRQDDTTRPPSPATTEPAGPGEPAALPELPSTTPRRRLLERDFLVKTGVESLLIVFSVLLALFLNDAWSARREAQETRELLASLREEIRANREVVGGWLPRHEAMAERIAGFRRDPARRATLVRDGELRLERLLGESLVETMVRSTAWDTAQATGLVRNFDLPVVSLLSDIYGLQRQGPVQSLDRVAATLFDRDSHREENLDGTLVLLEMQLRELAGQERLLLATYQRVLEELDAAGGGTG